MSTKKRRPKKGSKYKILVHPEPVIEEAKIDLMDIIHKYKEVISVNTELYFHISQANNKETTLDMCGYVTAIYPNFVLCRSKTDNYNFSISWKDIALGRAEVV